MSDKLVNIVSSLRYDKPEGTLIVKSNGDGFYMFDEQEWEPHEFWDWYCDNKAGVLYIYDQGAKVITQYELEHLSEIIFVDGKEWK